MRKFEEWDGAEDTMGLFRGLGVGIVLGVLLWAAILFGIWYFWF